MLSLSRHYHWSSCQTCNIVFVARFKYNYFLISSRVSLISLIVPVVLRGLYCSGGSSQQFRIVGPNIQIVLVHRQGFYTIH